MKELVGHYVAYRKLVSHSPSDLLAENQFRLYAVTARYPQNLSVQVPWQRVQAGVYDCQWGADTIRVVLAGELSREPHNAPLHLFSASADLVGFGGRAYQRRSRSTSGLLIQLFEGLQSEGFPMPYTMEEFQRQFVKDHFPRLTPEERRDVIKSLPPEERKDVVTSMSPEERKDVIKSLPPGELEDVIKSRPPEERKNVIKSLPPEERLAGLTEEQIRQYLDRLPAERAVAPRKPRRKT